MVDMDFIRHLPYMNRMLCISDQCRLVNVFNMIIRMRKHEVSISENDAVHINACSCSYGGREEGWQEG